MTKTFTLTKKHINKSIKLHKNFPLKNIVYCSACPIAVVLLENKIEEPIIGQDSIIAYAKNGTIKPYVIELPKKVQKWIKTYDALFTKNKINKEYLDNFQDFTFRLNIPSELSEEISFMSY